jgi:glycosyltransferase involved in cell wall biosynthesis
MNKRLLIVAAEFPPVKGIGRLRPLKFCQHLAPLGWETAVLTPEVGDIQPVDRATLLEIPKATRIYRTSIPKPKERLVRRLKTWLRRGETQGDVQTPAAGSAGRTPKTERGSRSLAGNLMGWTDAFARRNLLIPDDIILWYRPAIATGIAAVREFKPDVILATAPHFTNLLVGAGLSKATGVPWIADYRDLWTGDVLRAWVPTWRQKVELALERKILRSASAAITVSEPKSDVVRARVPNTGKCPVVTLTNGYDLEEFESVVPEQGAPGRYRVVYAGRLFKNRRGYEFVEAVGRLVQSEPGYRSRLRVEYYGGVSPEIAEKMTELITRYGIGDVIEFYPDVSYERSKALQKGADALLLIVDGGETTSGVIPGKLFEYVAADRPIICIAAPGATTGIIERGRLGAVVAPGDVDRLEAALKKLIDEGDTGFQPDRAYLEQFERSRIVGGLADLLDRVREANPRNSNK